MARNRYDIDEALEAPFSLTNLKEISKYLKKYSLKIILATSLSIIATMFALYVPTLYSIIIDSVLPSKSVERLIKFGFILGGIYLISAVLHSIRRRVLAKVSQGIVYDIRKDLFNHLQKLPFSYYDSRPHGKILVRVIYYVDHVSHALSTNLVNLILSLLNIIFIVIYMFRMDTTITLLTLSGIPVFLIILAILKPKQRKAHQEISAKNSNLNAFIQESIEGVNVIQAYNRQDINMEVLERLSEERRKAWMTSAYTVNLVWFSAENIANILIAAAYMVGINFLMPGMSLGVLIGMIHYVDSLWRPIIQISNIYNHFINTIAYLERIFETLNEPVVIDDKEDAYELPEIKGRVEFKDVNFSYDKGKSVLKNVNFVANPGESVAIVGPTGAGKTTIVNLISRFYNIEQGEVLIDGHNIMDVKLKSLRNQMGIMLQDSFLFSDSVENNIKYGKLNATREEVEEVARLLAADSFIQKMPDKYDTVIKERGIGLSEGEKQLLAFARTLISDPAILILDEATSSIDTSTEKLVQQGINTLLKGRTSFIIAHRLSTIKNCDKIMYIDKGQIMEVGTHDELIDKKGMYYQLYMSQYEKI